MSRLIYTRLCATPARRRLEWPTWHAKVRAQEWPVYLTLHWMRPTKPCARRQPAPAKLLRFGDLVITARRQTLNDLLSACGPADIELPGSAFRAETKDNPAVLR